MSASERRWIFCSVIFQVMAMGGVAWSLYAFVLMLHHITEGLQQGPLEWWFWTTLGIAALGIVLGLIIMHIQCKFYLNIWRRLKAFNRVIFVHNCPDSVCNGAEKATPPHTTVHSPGPGRSAEVAPV